VNAQHVLFIAVSLGSVACTAQAPTDINDITRYLFREWDNPDPLVMQAGLTTLEKILEGKKLGPMGAGNDRLLQVSPIHKEDLTVTPFPMDKDPANTLGTLVTRESQWPVIDHARVQADPNQLPVEPNATVYVRTYLEPTDPSCLIDASCKILRTTNEITRSNTTLQVTYTLLKNFRWVTMADGRLALCARAWAPMTFHGSTGGILQSYSIDIFLPRPGDVTWRYQASYSENELSIAVSGDLQVAVVTGAVEGALARADTIIGQRYHGLP